MFIILVPAGVKADTATGGRPDTGGATGGNGTPVSYGITSPLNPNIKSVGALVNKFVEIFSYIAIIFAVLAIVWTGFQLILARGKPDKLTENGKRLGAILIGVAIVIGARVMINIIISTLEATGTVSPSTINTIKGANQQ